MKMFASVGAAISVTASETWQSPAGTWFFAAIDIIKPLTKIVTLIQLQFH